MDYADLIMKQATRLHQLTKAAVSIDLTVWHHGGYENGKKSYWNIWDNEKHVRITDSSYQALVNYIDKKYLLFRKFQ